MKRAAICLCVLNEERSIREWIAYHSVLGFDSVIVYDNASSDLTVANAASLQGLADVVLIDWGHATGGGLQTACYADCCRRFSGEYEWIAFLDSDEFIGAPDGAHLGSLLADKSSAAGIALNWACFGSNGHRQTPDALTISAFTRRSDETFAPNVHAKVLVRPERVYRFLNPHFADLDGYYVRYDGGPVDWTSPGFIDGPVRWDWKINHYFVRSRQQWTEKLARGYRDPEIRRRDEEFALYDRNEIEDLSAAARAGEVDALLRSALAHGFAPS
jgi:glycosyltransferase involved in cell wall biosynthesis